VKIPSAGTDSFWALYRKLPKARKEQARKFYRLWAANALHGSLHFKPISDENRSVRVGDHTRAVGKFQGKPFYGNGSELTKLTTRGFKFYRRFGVRPERYARVS